MSSKEQRNGNTQLNSERESINKRISKFKYLGQSRKVQWDNKRSNRTI